MKKELRFKDRFFLFAFVSEIIKGKASRLDKHLAADIEERIQLTREYKKQIEFEETYQDGQTRVSINEFKDDPVEFDFTKEEVDMIRREINRREVDDDGKLDGEVAFRVDRIFFKDKI